MPTQSPIGDAPRTRGDRASQAPACPSCAGNAEKTIVGSGNWRLWRCRSCDLAFQFPLPGVAELDTLYGAQYFASNYADIEEAQRRFFARQIARLDRWVRPGVAVDVG